MALSREEEVDLTLQKNHSGVESALLYAKAWSKYIKDLLACMEKRLVMGELQNAVEEKPTKGLLQLRRSVSGYYYQWSWLIYEKLIQLIGQLKTNLVPAQVISIHVNPSFRRVQSSQKHLNVYSDVHLLLSFFF